MRDQRHRAGERAHPHGCPRSWALPNKQTAIKCIYMAIMSLDPTRQGRKRWSQRWKAALNAFEITFDGRLSLACL